MAELLVPYYDDSPRNPSPVLSPDRYLNQLHAGVDAYTRVQQLPEALIQAQGLAVLRETSAEMFGRTSCFATTVAMAINHLTDSNTFGLDKSGADYTLGDMVEVGIRTHLNDGISESGEIQKGHPSYDRRTGNMYHSFAKDFVGRFGIQGKVVEGFIDTSLFTQAIDEGAVLLLSVDNKVIPDISLKGQGITKLNSGRHLLFVHGNDKDGDILYTDVFNRPNAQEKPMNVSVPIETINNYLVSPAMPHVRSRAVVLWNSDNPLSPETTDELSPFDTTVRSNPLLSFDEEADLRTFTQELAYYQNQGITQWDLVENVAK